MSHGKKVSIEDFLEKFSSSDVELVVETYRGVGYKAKFIDKDFGEFWAYPRFVLQGTSHPKRSAARRKETLMSRYGTLCAASNPLIMARYRKEYLQKHGVDHPMRNKAVNAKSKATNIFKYGTTSPLANKEVQNKIKSTLYEKYGVQNAFQIPAVIEQIEKTNIERYGFPSSSQNSEIKLKILKSRYGLNTELMEKQIAKIVRNTRSRITQFISSCSRYTSEEMLNLIGCDKNFILNYLESKFQPGMTWDNYGKYGWHIDHIIPLSSAKNEDELVKLCHYTNLQPLWAKDNLSKGAKIP